MEVIFVLDNEYKEVYFYEYCEKCKYKNVDDVKDPCNECLDEPANLYSHKPVKFEPFVSIEIKKEKINGLSGLERKVKEEIKNDYR